MSEVNWLRRRAESADESEMPEKACHYRAAAAEIEDALRGWDNCSRTCARVQTERDEAHEELKQLRELVDLAIVYETTLPADWVSCARQLRSKHKASQ